MWTVKICSVSWNFGAVKCNRKQNITIIYGNNWDIQHTDETLQAEYITVDSTSQAETQTYFSPQDFWRDDLSQIWSTFSILSTITN